MRQWKKVTIGSVNSLSQFRRQAFWWWPFSLCRNVWIQKLLFERQSKIILLANFVTEVRVFAITITEMILIHTTTLNEQKT